MADLAELGRLLGARRSELGFDENEWEQFNVYIEAFQLFMERESQYGSLWQQTGAKDSLFHVQSKAARCKAYVDGTVGEDTAIDLINFATFLLRNVRAGRIESSVENGQVNLIDEWRVVDKWWTDEPIHREFRVISIDGSANITQVREEGQPWQVARQ